MGVVVSVVILSTALAAAEAPTPAPDPWPFVGVSAVLVGAATTTSATVVAVGQQAVVDDANAAGTDRQRAFSQLPVLWGVAVVGAAVLVAGVGVLVWRTIFHHDAHDADEAGS